MKKFTILQFIKSFTAFDLQGFATVKKLTLKILFLAIGVIFTTTATNAQSVWTSRTSAADNLWSSVTYGNGLFVAVTNTGVGNRVMTSPDGITWTIRTSAADNQWTSVTYGNGLFVAVSLDGTGNRVMTSPDGITWTIRTPATNNEWRSLTYGNGLFVAVSRSGFGDKVMTSPDGINWTSRTSAGNDQWLSVTYGNGLFVAVSARGGATSPGRPMTSPDGINWTIGTFPSNISLVSVTYGNGIFVTVAAGAFKGTMRSSDGINWTNATSPILNDWTSVTYGNGLFVAVANNDIVNNRVMTSPDGNTWTYATAAVANQWSSVTYGNGLFVAVAGTGTNNDRVMTSPTTNILPIKLIRFLGRHTSQSNILEWETASENTNKGFEIERSTDGIRFEKIGFVAGYGTTSQRKQYNFEDRINIGIVFYRLKQIDFDGRFEYSKIIIINTKLSPQLTIYPNPVKDIITISDAIVGTKAILTDISGKVLQKINVAATSITIDMSKYSGGVYLFKINNGVTQKIIKE